ncbi:hypothetical protein [Streptomyces radiopugnans]|uniref:hypothetical protein n=1 Tax=Streptomyces radiopugnans TaxID=403935 RepID=UPI003F1C7822
MVEEMLPARVEVESLLSARQKVAVCLGQGVETKAGHQSGVRNRLEVNVSVGHPPFQLDHYEAARGVQPQDVQPVPRRNPFRVGPPVELCGDHLHRLADDLRVVDHPLLKVLPFEWSFRSQPSG